MWANGPKNRHKANNRLSIPSTINNELQSHFCIKLTINSEWVSCQKVYLQKNSSRWVMPKLPIKFIKWRNLWFSFVYNSNVKNKPQSWDTLTDVMLILNWFWVFTDEVSNKYLQNNNNWQKPISFILMCLLCDRCLNCNVYFVLY